MSVQFTKREVGGILFNILLRNERRRSEKKTGSPTLSRFVTFRQRESACYYSGNGPYYVDTGQRDVDCHVFTAFPAKRRGSVGDLCGFHNYAIDDMRPFLFRPPRFRLSLPSLRRHHGDRP